MDRLSPFEILSDLCNEPILVFVFVQILFVFCFSVSKWKNSFTFIYYCNNIWAMITNKGFLIHTFIWFLINNCSLWLTVDLWWCWSQHSQPQSERGSGPSEPFKSEHYEFGKGMVSATHLLQPGIKPLPLTFTYNQTWDKATLNKLCLFKILFFC